MDVQPPRSGRIFNSILATKNGDGLLASSVKEKRVQPRRLRLSYIMGGHFTLALHITSWKPDGSEQQRPTPYRRGHLTHANTGWPQTGIIVAMAKRSMRKKTIITDLPHALILEIVSRLPPKSLCHCKCVSPEWYSLISSLDNLKKLRQTLAGFFFDTKDQGRYPKRARHFQNVNRGQPLIDPSFSFLPPEFEHVTLKDSCDGLLLCSSKNNPNLVVCNPATKRWVMVPRDGCVEKGDILALAFDRSIPSNFHVFQMVKAGGVYLVGTNIYSSKTGKWSYKEAGWDQSEVIINTRHVFHHGMMHFITDSEIVAVDTEGKKRIIPLPADKFKLFYKVGYVGQSQGHLYYMSQSGDQASVWFLENYDTEEWTLKHRASHNQLLGLSNQYVYHYEYAVISGHPDCSFFYIANLRQNLLMAYDIGREESEEHVAHACGNLGRGELRSVFPFVPWYQDLGLGCIAWDQGSPNELVSD